MRLKMLVLGMMLSTQVFAAAPGYEFMSVPHSEVDQYLVRGTDATGTPKQLQGLWWMNGNPLPDEVISFASTKWETIYEDGMIVGYHATVPVYDQGVWSWHDSVAGRALYTLANATELTYDITFNHDFSFGQVRPNAKLLPVFPSFTLPTSMLLDFTFVKVNENEYARDSIILGRPSTYRFRRLVDAEGNRLAPWNEFLQNVEAENALLPICTTNTRDTLPTSCAK